MEDISFANQGLEEQELIEMGFKRPDLYTRQRLALIEGDYDEKNTVTN